MLTLNSAQNSASADVNTFTYRTTAELFEFTLNQNAILQSVKSTDKFMDILHNVSVAEWCAPLSLPGAKTALERLLLIIAEQGFPNYLKLLLNFLFSDPENLSYYFSQGALGIRKIIADFCILYKDANFKHIEELKLIHAIYELYAEFNFLKDNKKEFILFFYYNGRAKFLEKTDFQQLHYYTISRILAVVLSFSNEILIDLVFKKISETHAFYPFACIEIAKYYQLQENFTQAKYFFDCIKNNHKLFPEAQISIAEMALALLPSQAVDKKLRSQLLQQALISCTKAIQHFTDNPRYETTRAQKISPITQILDKAFSLYCGYDALVNTIKAPAKLLDLSKSADSYKYQLKYKMIKYKNPALQQAAVMNVIATHEPTLNCLASTFDIESTSSLSSSKLNINIDTFHYIHIFDTITFDVQTNRFQFSHEEFVALQHLLTQQDNLTKVQWEKTTTNGLSLAHWLIILLEHIYTLPSYEAKENDIKTLLSLIQNFSAEQWQQLAMIEGYGNIAVINLFFNYHLQLLGNFNGNYLSTIVEKHLLASVSIIEQGKYASYSLLTQILHSPYNLMRLTPEARQKMLSIPAQEWFRNVVINMAQPAQSAFEILLNKMQDPNTSPIIASSLLFKLLMILSPTSEFITLDSALKIAALIKGTSRALVTNIALIYDLYRIQINLFCLKKPHIATYALDLKEFSNRIAKISFDDERQWLLSETYFWALKVFYGFNHFSKIVDIANNLSHTENYYHNAQLYIFLLAVKLAEGTKDKTARKNIIYQGLIAAAKLMHYLQTQYQNKSTEPLIELVTLAAKTKMLLTFFCKSPALNWECQKAEDLLDLSQPPESYISQLKNKKLKCKVKMLENKQNSMLSLVQHQAPELAQNLLQSFSIKRSIDELNPNSDAHEKEEYDPNSVKKRKV